MALEARAHFRNVWRTALLACATLAFAATAAAAPAPLSQDHARANIDSTYGSGKFGTWQSDRFGLPSYSYAIDELTNPIAKQPELGGNTDAWSQLGNDRVVANAYNHGYVQLWSQDRLYQWMNFYDAAHQHYAGGFGYINTGGKVFSTLYDDRPAGGHPSRSFGVGYYAKSVNADGLAEHDTVYAPFGNDSLLLHDVTITNTGQSAAKGSYFEYWDLNPEIQAVTQIPRGYQAPAWDAATKTLSAAQLPADTDTKPLTIFASALSSPVSAYDTDTSAFFGSGTRARPDAVAAGKLTDSMAPPSPAANVGRGMFAFQSPFALAPGQSVTLRYAYGYAQPDAVEPLVARYSRARNPLSTSERKWAQWLPQADLGAGYAWLARELQWDAYTVRSDSTYEDCAGAHILSQGGYYQYYFGENEAFRDPLQHMLPMIWSDPALARDVIRYSAEEQPAGLGAISYGRLSMCRRFDLGTSDDLDMWLLWSAAEYGLSTRDLHFFDTQLPYDDATGSGTLWDHLKLAFNHQENVVGTGPHGEYLTGATGDWNDISTEFLQMTESDLVTAQGAYIYPRLAELADARGDTAFAAQLRAAATRDLGVVKAQTTPGGWFARGYSGAREIGVGSIWSEPQSWALLAGAATPAQTDKIVAAYRRFLVGVGAPGGPSKIGATIAPSSSDPGATEQSEPPVNNSTEWPGGSWFAVDGWWTWALGEIGQRADAWDEYLRNTLANHATVFPDHWDGLLSVDDVCSAYFTSTPATCGIGLTTAYNTQIMHQPAYALFDLLKLAGVDSTASGYSVVPELPQQSFDIRLPSVGVAQRPGSLRGYFRTGASGSVTMAVAPPPGVDPADAVTWANGSRVPHTVENGLLKFSLSLDRGAASDWAVT
jgi:cellobiose phosphorylase